MARRNRRPGTDLFPFLSVLACVIGTLTLMLAALALGRVATDPSVDASFDAAGAAYGDASLDVALDLQTALRAVEAATRADVTAARVAKADVQLAELDRLREAVNALGAARVEDAAAARQQDSSASLEADLETLRRQLAATRASIRVVDQGLAKAPSPASGDRAIRLQPLGHGQVLAPFFAECSRRGVRLRSVAGTWGAPLRVNDVIDGPELRTFLQRVRDVRDGTVIFLIRPDGVATYQEAVRLADDLRVRHAKLPVPGRGEIDFSLL